MYAVDLRSIAKRYEGHVAVRNLSLQVPKGAVYGLLGPKGMSTAQIAYWDAVLAKIVATSEWQKEVGRNEAIPDYAGSKESAQRMARLYGQLKSALVDAGLARE